MGNHITLATKGEKRGKYTKIGNISNVFFANKTRGYKTFFQKNVRGVMLGKKWSASGCAHSNKSKWGVSRMYLETFIKTLTRGIPY